jgi:translation initiation factor 1
VPILETSLDLPTQWDKTVFWNSNCGFLMRKTDEAERMLRCAMTSSKDPKSPFAALEKLRADLPAGSPPEQPKSAPPTKILKGPTRAVVRYERKGRGGKEATIIEKLELKPKDLEQWCKELKQSLGCGGFIDGDSIVLQGDLRQRVPQLLTARNVGKVTVS